MARHLVNIKFDFFVLMYTHITFPLTMLHISFSDSFLTLAQCIDLNALLFIPYQNVYFLYCCKYYFMVFINW